MQIEVVFVDVDAEFIELVNVTLGDTIEHAIKASKVLEHFPTLSLSAMSVGIYGQAAELNTVLQENDRVEIYRNLKRDPKESRRLRADVQHKMDE